MNTAAFSLSALSQQAAALPNPATLPWVINGLWAILLASLCLGWVKRLTWRQRHRAIPGDEGGWGLRRQMAVFLLVVGLCAGLGLLGRGLSPAWWLGLAFQAPSLMSVALGLVWAFSARGAPGPARGRLRLVRPGLWGAGGLLLGWLLMLDLLALLPLPLYAWGFGTPALAGVMLILALGCLISGRTDDRVSADRVPACLALCITLFVLTRWPSGNLWDALLDPWLWLLLHARLVSRAVAPASLR